MSERKSPASNVSVERELNRMALMSLDCGEDRASQRWAANTEDMKELETAGKRNHKGGENAAA